ncbi:hypothetical protein IQ37_19150 [Chryseobacterium piperi]|uniref:Uncharacterized protein n=1 Tax=Chryseobacterium piperi TaxID=558152 RepID=A0A086AAJ8_9FLAO|nr:hypothetical protein [Chryseobacterium piperi]ASW75513.1 hypothetical protein CJF12_15305 [Chryseobacterium piperi]KFF13712.1 hypothetical protein IQ37_19150 [Chryseobacterium piperi]
MKKALLLSLSILNTSIALAQVGISTTNPQKALHVSGKTSSTPIPETSVNIVRPTVRVDGLSNINQFANNICPVSVTDEGDLVLSHPLAIPLLFIDPINTLNSEKDYIPSPIIINQTPKTTSTNSTIRSFNFDIPFPCLIKFNSITSFRFLKATDGSAITDGSSRLWGTRFRFSTAPSGISTEQNAYFGESLRTYNNVVDNIDGSGVLYISSDDTLFLYQGNYTLDIDLFVETESTQTSLRIICGEGSDTISIVAYPIQ